MQLEASLGRGRLHGFGSTRMQNDGGRTKSNPVRTAGDSTLVSGTNQMKWSAADQHCSSKKGKVSTTNNEQRVNEQHNNNNNPACWKLGSQASACHDWCHFLVGTENPPEGLLAPNQ